MVIALKRIVVDIDYCCLCQFELPNIYVSVSIFNVLEYKLNSWFCAKMVRHSRVIYQIYFNSESRFFVDTIIIITLKTLIMSLKYYVICSCIVDTLSIFDLNNTGFIS